MLYNLSFLLLLGELVLAKKCRTTVTTTKVSTKTIFYPEPTDIITPTDIIEPTDVIGPTDIIEPTDVIGPTDIIEPTDIIGEQSDQCSVSGYLTGIKGQCITENNSDCCVSGRQYPTFLCSPTMSDQTGAILTINGFSNGQDGGGASACDGQFHSNSELIVALSTGWFAQGSRCGHKVMISANGKSVAATVVDECDSRAGCDEEHAFQPPCPNNIVDASDAVWKALGISESSSQYGYMSVRWSDV